MSISRNLFFHNRRRLFFHRDLNLKSSTCSEHFRWQIVELVPCIGTLIVPKVTTNTFIFLSGYSNSTFSSATSFNSSIEVVVEKFPLFKEYSMENFRFCFLRWGLYSPKMPKKILAWSLLRLQIRVSAS